MDRSFRTTFSFNCTYAGNTLLLKKGNHRFAVDKAAYEKEINIPARLFVILKKQRKALMELKARYGNVMTPDQLLEAD